MPRQDGTGPNGQGPLTGRGLGSCESETNRNACPPCPRQNRRMRGGRGMGRGRGQNSQN